MGRFAALKKHPMWLVWDPHQGFWNRHSVRLIDAVIRIRVIRNIPVFVLVQIDTVILWIRVMVRRLVRVGPLGLFRGLRGQRILHIDCGTHKLAKQIRAVHDWFSATNDLRTVAFEASPAHYRDALESVASLENVTIHNVALVAPDYGEDTIKLYTDDFQGLGDSIFSERGESFDVVPARRLSTYLRDLMRDDPRPVVFRANIEGAEFGVIQDLAEADCLKHVNGYMGMWDDVAKINLDLDGEFRALLRSHRIRHRTFNDRDARWPLRMAAIKYDYTTSVLCGARRLAGERSTDAAENAPAAQPES